MGMPEEEMHVPFEKNNNDTANKNETLQENVSYVHTDTEHELHTKHQVPNIQHKYNGTLSRRISIKLMQNVGCCLFTGIT